MSATTTPHPPALPRLEPGITVLEPPAMRSPALHQIVTNELTETTGDVLWVDARNNAITHRLHTLVTNHHQLRRLQIARAFTAYQHHSLIKSLPTHATHQTAFIVVPCITSLYEDDDVPTTEAEDLLASSLVILRELASACHCPVLLTDTAPDTGLSTPTRAAADTHINCTKTSVGYHYTAPGFETTVYWNDRYWQTTIPYWVELFGALDPMDPIFESEPELFGLTV